MVKMNLDVWIHGVIWLGGWSRFRQWWRMRMQEKKKFKKMLKGLRVLEMRENGFLCTMRVLWHHIVDCNNILYCLFILEKKMSHSLFFYKLWSVKYINLVQLIEILHIICNWFFLGIIRNWLKLNSNQTNVTSKPEVEQCCITTMWYWLM